MFMILTTLSTNKMTKYDKVTESIINELKCQVILKLHPRELLADEKNTGKMVDHLFCMSICVIGVIAAVLNLGLSLIYWNDILLSDTKDFSPVRDELADSLFGQQNAIDALERAWNLESSSLLVVMGGVGVGKTLTASTIWKHFPVSHKSAALVQSQLGTFNWEPAIYLRWSLMIIDDCDKNFDGSHVHSIKTFFKAAAKGYHTLLIVLVCTVVNDSERVYLETMLSQIKEDKPNIIKFEPLSRYAVMMCFLKEIMKNKLTVNDEQLEEFVSEQMENIPEIGGPPGCKMINVKIIERLGLSEP